MKRTRTVAIALVALVAAGCGAQAASGGKPSYIREGGAFMIGNDSTYVRWSCDRGNMVYLYARSIAVSPQDPSC